jgi:alpha-beta hydrolase superfamily lysophospholipase
MSEQPEMQWTIEGAEGQPIIGDAHVPLAGKMPAPPFAGKMPAPLGVVLIVHGFLGYKDYGMFPYLARSFAEAGFIAHRFNLSHSGMTNAIETFERPDLFERDTWNKQVFDIARVMEFIAGGSLLGQGLPIVLLGHSRGGASVLLTAGRRFNDGATPLPAGVISLAAPSACDRVSDDAKRSMQDRGFYEVVSNRTGQTLRIGRAWLDEQLADPAGHDLLGLAAKITCPVLVAHADADETVPAENAREIATACPGGRALMIEGANHVLNAPNPMSVGTNAPVPLERFTHEAIRFAKDCASPSR